MPVTLEYLKKLQAKYRFALTNPALDGRTTSYLKKVLAAIEYRIATF